MKPIVELVTTGAELLNGRVVNRHAAWLGGQLENIDWRLMRDTTVPDDEASIHDALFQALQRCDVVIITGGLGPTSDDVTRDVAAAWAATRVIMHEPTRQQVLDMYHARNKPLNETVERHALVVDGAKVLENNHGLAPGEHITTKGKHVFLLPGPPREFQGVMIDHVLPWLAAQGVASTMRMALFQTVGLGESDIAAQLERQGFAGLRLETAYCAEPGRVTIRIREILEAAQDFESAVQIVRTSLADSIYSEAEESIEVTVGRMLTERGLTLAVAESCTGGLVGQRFTAIPGSSVFFRGGVIVYHNDLKTCLTGVPADMLTQHGAVSEPVATAMAHGVRALTKSDIGIAVTGIAGPDGGSPDKPVGLVYLACATDRHQVTRQLRLGGGREIIRETSATMAIDLIRRCILSASV